MYTKKNINTILSTYLKTDNQSKKSKYVEMIYNIFSPMLQIYVDIASHRISDRNIFTKIVKETPNITLVLKVTNLTEYDLMNELVFYLFETIDKISPTTTNVYDTTLKNFSTYLDAYLQKLISTNRNDMLESIEELLKKEQEEENDLYT